MTSRLLTAIALSAAFAGLTGCEEKTPPVTPGGPGTAPRTAASPPGTTATTTTTTTSSTTTTETPKTTTPSIPGLSADTTQAIKDMAGNAKDKVVSAMQSGLDTVKGQIAELTEKVKAAPADKQPAAQSALDKIKTQYDAVSKNLSSLKTAAGNEWQKLSDDAKSGMDNLKKSVNDLMAQFK